VASARPAPIGRFRLSEQHHESQLGRWTLVEAAPPPPLSAFVEAVWAARSAGLFTHQAILPRTPTEVLFPLGHEHWLRDPADATLDRAFTQPFVSGLQLRPLAVESPADSEMCGIRLRPAGVAAFLGDSPALIAGRVAVLGQGVGPAVDGLRDQLTELPSLRARVLLLAAAVERYLDGQALPRAEVGAAVRDVLRRPARVRVRDLVTATGWSHRHLVTRFRDEIGVAPKAFARIARFQAAFARLERLPVVRWPEFALDAGYADQAHLIHDFRALAGATPTEVRRLQSPDGLGLLDERELRERTAASRPVSASA
jgi:AraC-like DNA-binding protein